jgi:CheY-like chemotaxis protein
MTIAQGTPLDGKRVLLVEDNEDTRDLYALLLERCGAHVTTADTADEALATIAAVRPDVIIADISLPDGEDGCELLKAVRQLGPDRGGDTPAVAVSGWAAERDRARGIDAGFQVYLSKPVSLDVLAAVVASLAKAGHAVG